MEIEIENRLDAMIPCLERVEAYLKQQGVELENRLSIGLCLEEILINTIRYGYPKERTGKIHIALHASREALHLEITDDAVPFNPLEASASNAQTPLAERPIGGLGIPLLHHFCDEIRYAHLAQGNRITLKKYLGTAHGN